MRTLTYLVSMTLDGFIAAPDGSYDFFPAQGDHLDALVAEYPEALPAGFRDLLGISGPGQHFDTVLEGRATHQVGLDAGVADAYPHLRHIVYSSTVTNDAVEVITTDALESVRALKQEDGLGIWLCGGGSLAATLLPEIDELLLKIAPVVIGDGIRLFDAPFAANAFELVSTRSFETGVVWARYRRAAHTTSGQKSQGARGSQVDRNSSGRV